jgi:hypothetical protein
MSFVTVLSLVEFFDLAFDGFHLVNHRVIFVTIMATKARDQIAGVISCL